MGRIAEQMHTLAQGFTHQTDITLGQVSHPAVYQLGRPRGRAFGKVPGFQHNHTQAPQGRVQSHAQAGSATTHHDHIHLRGARQGAQHLGSVGQ